MVMLVFYLLHDMSQEIMDSPFSLLKIGRFERQLDRVAVAFIVDMVANSLLLNKH